ncbi:MAG: helix-turn-helix transcriptional regulator [Desulfobacterales bacterium]|jgi:transcriptional regulator with XRE-family HTH domain
MNIELKVARLRAELSQHKLSRITGISQTLISNFEQGYTMPTVKQAQLIAKALNIGKDKLFSNLK